MIAELIGAGRAAVGDPPAMLNFANAIARSEIATDEQRIAATFARNSLRKVVGKAEPSDAALAAASIRFEKLIKALETTRNDGNHQFT